MRTAWLATPVLRAVGILILVTITVAGLSVSSWAGVCEGLDGGPGDLDGDLVLETYWYLADHLLSVQSLTDSLGVSVESYVYGDYGQPEIFDGSGTSLGIRSAKGNPYMFTGLEFQGEVYLYTFGNRGARYMDPRAGRFTSRDRRGAWGDSGNTGNAFGYAGSNPLSRAVNRSSDDGVIREFHWTQVE